MAGIDAHQHFWQFDPLRDNWITEDMSVIRRDFLPADIKLILQQHGFDGSVVVQSDQSVEENIFQLKNAAENDFIKGVVGWVDLRSKDVEAQLAHYRSYEKIKGFRHILQGEPKRDLMLDAEFMNGIGKLKRFGFTYDILVFADQLRYIPQFVSAFPEQLFVIDHIAKPAIKQGRIQAWKKDIQAVAAHENVYCKISGMVTEADWKNWKQEDFVPYLDAVVEAFGTERIMYGSDWPVCLVAADYAGMLGIVTDYFSSFSRNEQELFFGNNAIRFYNLS